VPSGLHCCELVAPEAQLQAWLTPGVQPLVVVATLSPRKSWTTRVHAKAAKAMRRGRSAFTSATTLAHELRTDTSEFLQPTEGQPLIVYACEFARSRTSALVAQRMPAQAPKTTTRRSAGSVMDKPSAAAVRSAIAVM